MASYWLLERSPGHDPLSWIVAETVFGHLIGRMTGITVKILKIGTPEIITIIVLQLEQLAFTVQYCVQKMQTE